MGQKCDLCETFHYGFSSDGCQPCECDRVGSRSLQCDATGQCPCRENVDGRQCDRCQENTYDKQAGCRDCPACYTLVLDSVSVHRERLAELERLLQDILIHPTVLNDEVFEETLSTVMSQVENLWKDAQEAARSEGDKTVAKHIEELEERIGTVMKLLKEIRIAIGLGSDLALQGEFNITQAEGIIQRAQEALRNAQLYLDVQGNEALRRALESSEGFGQQSERMTQIASEARTLADKQEDEAESIEQVAYEARNISDEAVTLVRKAVNDQRDITNLIKGLKTQVEDVAALHDDTLKVANESRILAKATYLEALAISTDASSIAIPLIDAAELKAEATTLSQEADQIKAEAERLIGSRQDLVVDVQAQLEETRELVERGREQQQITAELLADTFTAEGQAKDAIKTAEKTLSEAQETLTILEGFDKLVQESREEAKDALGRVDVIQRLIDEAEERTDEAEAALTGAEEDAKNARDIALQAQETANEASEEAGEVRLKADATKAEAIALKDTADELASRVAGTEARVADYELRVESDKQQVLEAQEKANQAKGRADDASARVHQAYETVQEILDLLERSTDLDPSQLDALERRLNEAWQTYHQSGIETTVSEFTEARNWQRRQISVYEEEIRRLQIEVRNIEEIKISLPDGCYSRIKLEP